MIKSLRKRFIIVAMCSTFLVLAVIMGTVNIANYCRMLNRADNMTAILTENDGKFARLFPDNGEKKQRSFRKKFNRDDFSPETRFFSVVLDEEGNVLFCDVDKIASISKEEAGEYAKKIFENNSVKGFEDEYRYRKIACGADTLFIFLNCRQELSMFKFFMLISLSVSLLGFITVSVLIIVFSKIVIQPVAESYEKQKRFITDASHEIKTPLTIIDANTEVLEMESGENQWTKSTRNQVKRLTLLTQQLITLTKLDERNDTLEKSNFSISDAVIESIQSFCSLAETKNKRLDVRVEENIRFLGDEKSIRQMIGILMDNAIKYSAAGGAISVSLKRKGKKIQLKIFNEAEDIPQGKLDVLFERFYRLDTSRNSETGGSGIGLSVVKAIVLSQGGKINAYSTDGNSLTVEIIL